jgi:DNA-binding PadR family transcriptional regulator
MTRPTQEVLRALVADPAREFYGLELADAARLQAGTIYPIVRRLEDLGWLTGRWEDIDEQAERRPRRRYYQLTSDGLPAARQALAEADLRRRRAGRLPKRQESPGW